MEFELSETQILIKNMVRELAEKELEPNAEKYDDERVFPIETIKKISALKLLGIFVPEKYGGTNLDTITYSLILEELGRCCASTAMSVAIHNS